MKKVCSNDVNSSKLQNLLMTLKEGVCKKALLTASVAALCAGILFGSSLTASASDKFPVGDLPDAPEMEELELEIDENSEAVEGNFLTPAPLGVELTTGKHYEYLSDDEKVLYAAIYQAVMGGQYVPYAQRTSTAAANSKIFTFYTGSAPFTNQYTNKADFSYAAARAAEACYYDHANKIELYMVSPTYYGSTLIGNGQYASWMVFVANYDDTKFATLDAQIDSKVNTIVSTIKGYGGNSAWPARNEMIAHDYFCGVYKLVYDQACLAAGNGGYYDFAHTAYGSIVEGSAVCDGYSAGFELIMEKLGVPTMVITGMAGTSGDNGGHAWNIVQLDGNWYEVDTTWADVEQYGKIRTQFFNQTTSAYETGIMGTFHKRVTGINLVGFRMPVARGTHWTRNYIAAGNYAHDTTIWTTGITAPANFVLDYGTSVAFPAVVAPANATNPGIVLTSSNPGVIAVNGNVVTAVGLGTAVVTATTVDGGFQASSTISVNMPVGATFGFNGANYILTSGTTVAFAGGTNSATVNIPAKINVNGAVFSVTAIADNAFMGNGSVKTVKGGKNIKSIGSNAFSGCKRLKSVKLSSAKITKIGAKAFFKSKKLANIEINGNKLKKVGKNAFKGIKKSANIKIKVSSKSKYKKVVKLVKKAGGKGSKYKKN